MNSSISHVALLVPSVEQSAAFLNSLGVHTNQPETFDSEGTKEIYVGSYEKQSGLLLLVEAIGDGPYKRAMEKRGPSLHHIAIDTLAIEEFLAVAERAGWSRHSVTAETLTYGTAWLYAKGVPTLIEVHQRKSLSSHPLQVSRIEISSEEDAMNLFAAIGLDGLVFRTGGEPILTINGHRLAFSQIAKSEQR